MISIVTASIGRKTLKDLYLSLRAQKNPNWEWRIIFDGREGYSNIVEGFKESSTRIFYKTYKGKRHCFGREQRRLGIAESQGDYIIIVDDDDLLRPNCIEVISKIKTCDLIVWRTKADWLGRIVPDENIKNVHSITNGDICINSYAFNRDLAERIKYPLCGFRRVHSPGIACDFHFFTLLRRAARHPILLENVLSEARHNYPGRGKEPKWVSRFGH